MQILPNSPIYLIIFSNGHKIYSGKEDEHMGHLKEYCLAICCIDGIDTYIISPEHYSFFIDDQALLEDLIPSWAKNWVIYFVQAAKKFDALYVALGHHKNGVGLSLEWEPVLCYKKGNTFFHVKYFESWMCRECGYIFCAPIIIPMCEADPDFYYETENRFPDIPPFFQKLPCPKCNRLLQNHFIVLR